MHQAGTDLVLSRRTLDSPVVYRGERRGAIATESIYLRIVDHGATRELRRGGGGVNPRVDLWQYAPVILFIRNYSVTRGDGIPTLCRRGLARTSNRMSPTICLIEGIENLQLEYGIDEDGDQRAHAQQVKVAPADAARLDPHARVARARLGDGQRGVRASAAEGLGGIGPAAGDAVTALTAALGDEEPRVRMYAASALGWIGPAAKPAVLELVALLKDVHVRDCAVFALGRIGPAAREAVPALEALAKDGARGAEFALSCIRGTP